MSQRRLVLVPLDGSAGARAALAAAARVAEFAGAEIIVLHVSEHPVEAGELADRLGRDQALLERAELAQATGRPAAEIVRAAAERQAWLIVMSSRGDAAWRQSLGSVTASVIQDSPCPVLVVRPDIPEAKRTLARLDRVLLPLDGSPGSAAAVAPAAELARRASARLDLLHVATVGQAPPEERGTMVGPRYLDAPQHEWPAWAQEFLQRFGPPPDAAGVRRVRLYAARGGVAEEVLRHASDLDSDLVAIAWHQTLAPARAEIVKRLIVDARCPLLFVPTTRHPSRAPAGVP